MNTLFVDCRETALRLFASAGVSAQIGRFKRPVLDFTAASARLDFGLSAPFTGACVHALLRAALQCSTGGQRCEAVASRDWPLCQREPSAELCA